MTEWHVPLPDQQIQREWFRRIEAEYRSAAQTHHFTLWLIQLGAPYELIEMGLRVVGDELIHAELSATVYKAAGGANTPQLAPASLQLSYNPNISLHKEALRLGVDIFCLGETVAVRLFKRLREHCIQPDAVTALDRILKDEVFHRDFGWILLEWLLSTPWADELRLQLKQQLPAMLLRIHKSYVHADRDNLVYPEARRAWGLMPAIEYLQAVEETIQRDYKPRFNALNIAWPDSFEAYSKRPLN